MEGTLGVGALAVVLERELRLSELPRGRLRGFPFLRKGKKRPLSFGASRS